jgi:putative transposase
MPEPKFPSRLHHQTPPWVKPEATFHIRLRTSLANEIPLTDTKIAPALLHAAKFYHDTLRWHCRLFLLMPDHAHALLSFPPESTMARIIGDWKGYTAKTLAVKWQPNFFDHRIRDQKGLEEKHHYILANPVVKELCLHPNDWPHRWPQGGT